MIVLIAVATHTRKTLEDAFDKDKKRKADDSCGM